MIETVKAQLAAYHPFEGGTLVPCLHCNALIDISKPIPLEYFAENRSACLCNDEKSNWWQVMLRVLRENDDLAIVLAPVGAKLAVLGFPLIANQLNTIDLNSPVPPDAEMLQVIVGSNGFMLAELIDRLGSRREIPRQVRLYPVPVGPGPHSEARGYAAIAWVQRGPNRDAWRSLTDAFREYADRQYDDMAIAANVAVESTLSRFLARHLRASKEDEVKGFLRDAATYHYQLTVLLPTLVELSRVPTLQPEIFDLLIKLKKRRNKLAHGDDVKPALDKETASKLLCAALFGFHYLNVIEPLMPRVQGEQHDII